MRLVSGSSDGPLLKKEEVTSLFRVEMVELMFKAELMWGRPKCKDKWVEWRRIYLGSKECPKRPEGNLLTVVSGRQAEFGYGDGEWLRKSSLAVRF